MGHTWKAEIIRGDGSSITYADGDDVATTTHTGLRQEPEVTLELNMPGKAVLTIDNEPGVPSYNLRSSSCSLWSYGSSGAVSFGQYVRVEQFDHATRVLKRTFVGKIKSIEEGEQGGLVITAHDELMRLGELKDAFQFFAAARDRVGDSLFGRSPDISASFNAAGQITALLPDQAVQRPLMRCVLADPRLMYDNVLGRHTGSSSGGRGVGQGILVDQSQFYRLRFRYRNSGADALYRYAIYSTDSAGNPSTLVINSDSFYLPASAELQEFEGPVCAWPLEPGKRYVFAIEEIDEQSTVTFASGSQYEVPPNSSYYKAWYKSTSGWTPPQYGLPSFYEIVPLFYVEREVDSARYILAEEGSGTRITIDTGDTTITAQDLTDRPRVLRLSYFYGRLSAEEIMEGLLTRAGLSPSRAGSLGTGTTSIGFYNTANNTYLACLQELAEFWETSQGIQWAVAKDHGGALDSLAVRIGARRKSWSEPIGSCILSDDPTNVEDGGTWKRILSHGFKRGFAAKVGTAQVIGQAFDGSPIAVQVDDRLWGTDSLIDRTGTELIELIMDQTAASGDQAARVAESYIREQHQNHVEGPLRLSGLWPSLWNLDSGDPHFGGGEVVGLIIPNYGLSSYGAVARRMVLGQGRTDLEFDNIRLDDQNLVKRAMDRTLRSEAFDVSSLPETVYIFARTASLPSWYGDVDRMRLIRADATAYSTIDFGTMVRRSDDNCSPDARGYTHFAGYIPGRRLNGPTSYRTSPTPSISAFTQVAIGTSTGNWQTINLSRPYHVWSHQGVLVDVYGQRPS